MAKRFKDAEKHSKGSSVRHKELMREDVFTKFAQQFTQALVMKLDREISELADPDESWQASEALLKHTGDPCPDGCSRCSWIDRNTLQSNA